jgi:hypothetical protein
VFALDVLQERDPNSVTDWSAGRPTYRLLSHRRNIQGFGATGSANRSHGCRQAPELGVGTRLAPPTGATSLGGALVVPICLV